MKQPDRILLATALALPDVSEGIACKGTSLESRTAEVRGKAFVFVRAIDARLKLADSLVEAHEFAAAHPAVCNVGAGGWVTLKFGGAVPTSATLRRWVAESRALVEGKLDKPGKPAPKKKRRS